MAPQQLDEQPMTRFRALLGELSAYGDIADSQDLRALALGATGHRSDHPLAAIDPIELVKEGPQPGDMLVRIAEGVEYLGVIVGDYVGPADAFAARGIVVESAGPGLFVEVAEVPFGGGAVNVAARRITDSWRRCPRRQRIYRPERADPAGVDDDGEDLFESEELARHAAYDSKSMVEPGPAVSRPTILTSAQLREAWASYECAEEQMIRLRLFGRWDTPVNPETVDAWRMFERTLVDAGYQPHGARTYDCRQIAGQQTRSLHAYGLAIDIDHDEPTCNVNRPTPDGRAVRFSTAATKDERCHDVRRGVADTSFTPGQVEAVEAIQTVDGQQVFAWGGRWRTTKDTMHFQINVTPTQLGRGIRLDAARSGPVPTSDTAETWTPEYSEATQESLVEGDDDVIRGGRHTLLDRVRDVLTEDPARAVMNGNANWAPRFGGVIPIQNIRTIVVHQTAGWPARSKSEDFVRRYTMRQYGENEHGVVAPCQNCPPANQNNVAAGCECKWGIGPMYYISYDGTIARLISNVHTEARITWHAGWVNDQAIGIETGNLFRTAPPPGNGWIRVSQAPGTEDQPGANLFVRDMRGNPREVIACWWTTANYAGPAREHVGTGRMLFSEAQYRSWALLGRFLAEQFRVPRNLPLLPWASRPDNVAVADSYRRIVLADPAFDAIVADLPAAWQMPAATFEKNPETLQARYHARIAGAQNEAWLRLFRVFRGFHGHIFSGDTHSPPKDHDCPGPMFDWHRFARELWDWWWYPFDVQDVPPTNTTTTAVQPRGYRQPDRTTPLIEHYFDDDNHDPAVGALDARHAVRRRDSIEGADSSGITWRLDPGSPVYAMANGELVAARFAQPADVVSMSFLLVRHLIIHQTVGGADPIEALRLDYDHPPSTVYSLYMHIGHPQGLDLTAVNVANPDWLNRVHIRKKECQLGIDFYDHPAPLHHGIDNQAWNQPLPGQLARPTLVDSWRNDQAALDPFLADLAAGRIATAPLIPQSTPIRIILGDYLGTDGAVAKQGAGTVRGIRVEAFSPQPLPGFTIMLNQYQSEWSLDLNKASKAYRDHLRVVGVDLDLVTWWPFVEEAMRGNPHITAADRLPKDGRVFHLEVFKFMRWINDITWKSEWPKYQLQDTAGHRLPAPPQPRSRRW